MTRLVAATLLLLLVVPCAADTIMIRRAAAGGQTYDDDFATDPLASRWVAEVNPSSQFSWTANVFDLDDTDSNGVDVLARYDSALDTIDHCVCATFTWSGSTNSGPGVVLRAGTDAETNESLFVGVWFGAGATTSDDYYLWLFDGGGQSCDIGKSTATLVDFASGWELCAQSQGTGAWIDASPGSAGSTTVQVWAHSTPTQDCSGTVTVSYTGWTDSSGTCLNTAQSDVTDTGKYGGLAMQQNSTGDYHIDIDDFHAEDK